MAANPRSSALFSFGVPALFVWLWSTGFIGAKYGLPFAEPFTLLLIRMLLTLALLGVLAWMLKAKWPGWRGAGHLAITGLLVHGCYLGGVYYAIDGGMPSGIISLIVGMQPLVTSAVATMVLNERVSVKQWLGLVLGLVGVCLVLLEKFGFNESQGSFPAWTLIWDVADSPRCRIAGRQPFLSGATSDRIAGLSVI